MSESRDHQRLIDHKSQWIANYINRDIPPLDNPGLMYGNAGLTVVFAFLYHVFQAPRYADKALKHLKIALGQASNKDLSLASGLTGIAFAIRYLIGLEMLRNDDAKLLATLDGLISMSIERDFQQDNMDYLFGALGKINYAFFADQHHEHISNMHDYFFHHAIKASDQLFWSMQPQARREDTNFDLGIAHGQSAVLYMLAKTSSFSRDMSGTEAMLRSGAHGIMTAQLENEVAFFPSKTGSVRPSRLCWCNGDIGIISALLACYETTGDKEIKSAALEGLQRNAVRTLETSLIKTSNERADANLCHGVFSPAMLFDLASQAYPEEEAFQQAFDYWVGQVVKQLEDQPIRQYEFSSQTWENKQGLLDGDAGVLMFLASTMHEDYSILKKVLLLDVF